MRKRSTLLVLVLILITSLLAALCVSCKKTESDSDSVNTDNSTSGGSSSTDINATGIVNGFDTIEDLYNVKFNVGNDYRAQYKSEINSDTAYIYSGRGSLKITFLSAYKYPEPVLYLSQVKGFDEAKLLSLSSVSAYVYNAQTTPVNVNLNMHGKNNTALKTAMTSKQFEVEGGKWTKIEIPVSHIVMEYNGNNVLGFGIEICCAEKKDANTKQPIPQIFYIDELSFEYNTEETEEEKAQRAKIDALIEKIGTLPNKAKVKLTDEADIAACISEYNAIPSLYRGAVKNYSALQDAVSGLKELYELDAKNNADENSCRVLFTDKMFGYSHFSATGDYAQTAEIIYSSEVKYGDDAGSTAIAFDGKALSPWSSWWINKSADLSNYDFVSIHFKNDTNYRAVVFFPSDKYGWSKYVTINNGGEWTEVVLPADCMNRDFQIAMTGEGERVPTGNFYISSCYAYSLGINNGYADAVDSFNAEGAMIETSGNVSTFTATQNKVKIKLNKDNSGNYFGNNLMNALVNIKVDKFTTLHAQDADGNAVADIALSAGWNTIEFAAKSYNFDKIEYLVFDAKADDKVAFDSFVKYPVANSSVMQCLLQSKYCLTEEVSVNNLLSTAKYLNTFYSLTDDEHAFVIENSSDIVNKTENLKSKFVAGYKAIIDSTYSAFDSDDAFIVQNVYEEYQKLVSLKKIEAFGAEIQSKIEKICQTLKNTPYFGYDFTKSDDVAAISTNLLTSEEKDPYTVMHNDNPSYNVIKGGNDSVFGGYVELTNPTYSGNGPRFNFMNPSSASEKMKRIIGGYDYVTFYVYNPLPENYLVRLRITNCDWGRVYLKPVVLSYGWNFISLPVSDFKGAIDYKAYIYLWAYKDCKMVNGQVTDMSGKALSNEELGNYCDNGIRRFFANATTETLKISSFRLYSTELYNKAKEDFDRKNESYASAAIEEAIRLIDTLGDASELRSKTAEINEVLSKIAAVVAKYGSTKITNYDKYAEFIDIYNDLPYIVLDAETEKDMLSTAKRDENDLAAECYDQGNVNYTIDTDSDDTYGKVMVIKNVTHSGSLIRINYLSGLADATEEWTKRLAGMDYVYLHVYNPLSVEVIAYIMQGDWVLLTDDGDNCKYTLKSGWNTIVISKAAFINSTKINRNADTFYHGNRDDVRKSDCGYYLMFKDVDDSNKLLGLGVNGKDIKISSFYGFIGNKEDIPVAGRVKTYTVTFDSDGGTAVESQIVNEGEKVVQPKTPTKKVTGKTVFFKGWFYTENGVTKQWDFNNDTVNADITLVAKWEETEYSEWIPIED